MADFVIFSIFILAYGALGSVLGLSGLLWARRREQRLLKTFLFFLYLTILFFFSGLRFGSDIFGLWKGAGTILVFNSLERAAYASLIYFLPATVNYILGRTWTSFRLARVLIAATVYFFSGLASLFLEGSLFPGLLAALAFLLIFLFVMIDAARSLPMVPDESTRTALFLFYGITFLFLPLTQVLPLFTVGQERTLFLATSLYYLSLGVAADIFFLRALVGEGKDASADADAFGASCRAAGLTPRESEIAALIARGLTYKEIAAELEISPNTVSNHVATAYRKTETRSKVEMVNALRKDF